MSDCMKGMTTVKLSLILLMMYWPYIYFLLMAIIPNQLLFSVKYLSSRFFNNYLLSHTDSLPEIADTVVFSFWIN